MTHKILRSFFPTEEHEHAFHRLVNSQIDEMRAHDAHMANVKKEPNNYHPYPPPIGHPDVMNSIVKEGDDYNIAFELVDEERTLEEKKAKLHSELIGEVAKRQQAVIPHRKRNIHNIERSKLKAIEKPNATQKKRLDEIEKMNSFSMSLHEHFAKMEAEIEDLNERNVDKWKAAPFPEFKS